MKISQKSGYLDLIKDKNFLASILAIVFSFYMLVSTTKASSAYPYVIFSLMMAFGVLLLVTTVVKKNYSSVEAMSWKELLFIAVLLINPFFAKTIGFYVSAFIEVFVISIFISKQRTKKVILFLLLFSVLVTLFSYVIFTFGLRIRCPKGALSLF